MSIAEPIPALFDSPDALHQAFEDGLVQMLEQPVLGAFVLALANAGFETQMWERLRPSLYAAFAVWCRRFDHADPMVHDAAPDDIDVFVRLRALGLDRLTTTRWREVGPWQVQFNPLRALRPPRASGAVVTTLQRPFDAEGFHFNKPFLRREILWEGELCGAPLRVLYNKFPFAERHGLLVPYPERCRPQYLSPEDHALVWRLVERLGHRLSGLGVGYNAYGAYASINHLHFQCFVRGHGSYPIESAHWRHNGGDLDYPLPVIRVDDPGAAWSEVEALHAARQAYNLLYRPGVLYAVARRRQGEFTPSGWTSGFAWSELCGAVTTFDEGDFTRLSAEDIEREMTRLALTGNAAD